MYRQQNHQRQSRPWADLNHRSPVYKTGAVTTMLQSQVTESYQALHCLIELRSKNQKRQRR